MFVSYSQNFEDVILWRALKEVKDGFYIDIGAQDPVIASVSRGFYEKGWRGIHVEPTETYAERLRNDRPDEKVVQAAVGVGGGELQFFEIPETGLSTGDPIIAEKHRQNGFLVNEKNVMLLSLAEILEGAGNRDIHWLKIDVEGMERSVLESWSPSQKKPWLVVAESTLPLQEETSYQEWEEILFGMGYDFVYFDGLNRFYVSKQREYLKRFFGPGPNYFDDFVISDRAQSDAARLLDQNIRTLQEYSRSLEVRLADQESLESNLNSRLKASEMELKALSEKVESYFELTKGLSDELKRAEDREKTAINSCEVLQKRIDSIHESISWKVTFPLRAIKSWFQS